jgi:hypothetical protein
LKNEEYALAVNCAGYGGVGFAIAVIVTEFYDIGRQAPWYNLHCAVGTAADVEDSLAALVSNDHNVSLTVAIIIAAAGKKCVRA